MRSWHPTLGIRAKSSAAHPPGGLLHSLGCVFVCIVMNKRLLFTNSSCWIVSDNENWFSNSSGWITLSKKIHPPTLCKFYVCIRNKAGLYIDKKCWRHIANALQKNSHGLFILDFLNVRYIYISYIYTDISVYYACI